MACKLAAMLCEEDLEAGEIGKRYERLKADHDGPSVEAIEAGMRELIEELVKRGKLI